MSRALETLVRLQQAQIDDAKSALSVVVAARTQLAMRDATLVAENEAEQTEAARDPAGIAAYGGYAPRMVQARRALAEEDARLAAAEAEVRDRLAAAYIELKKIEHLRAVQAERERVAENARELAALDEAAANRAARRQR